MDGTCKTRIITDNNHRMGTNFETLLGLELILRQRGDVTRKLLIF